MGRRSLLLKRGKVGLLACLALRKNPLFRTALQQGPSVEFDRAGQRLRSASGDGPIELQNVHERVGEIQLEAVGRDCGNDFCLFAQKMAKLAELSAKVVEREALVTVRPEGGRDPVARNLSPMPQGEQCQQVPAFAAADGDWLVVKAQVERAKQLQTQRSRGFAAHPDAQVRSGICGLAYHFQQLTRFSFSA